MHAPKIRPSLALTTVLMTLMPVAATHAQVTNYAAFKNTIYQQTGPAAPTTPSGFFFGGQITVTDPVNDATTATITPPGGTAEAATLVGSTFFDTSNTFATKADLDASYSNGTYTFAVDGGDGVYTPDSGSLTITQDISPSAIPTFTPGTVAPLSSYDPASAFTFNFNSFTPDPNATEGFTFFGIFDPTTGQDVPNTETSLFSSGTSFTLPGGTLLPFHNYQVNLDFSNRQDTSNAGFPLSGGATATVAFDNLTQLNFTTAPEPSQSAALALGALGLAGLGWKARRRAAL